MIRRPPRSTRTDTLFPTRRPSDLPSRRNDRSWVRFHESGIHSKARAMHGWIILDKPVGLGSTQAVAAVKRALRTGGYPKRKVGHGGTLDPLASGVLPIAIGAATKLAGRMLDGDQSYALTNTSGGATD